MTALHICPRCQTLIPRGPCACATTTRRGYGGTWPTISAAILDRDHRQCQIRSNVCTGHATTVDHIIPKAAGGTDHPDNLQAACAACNSAKSSRHS